MTQAQRRAFETSCAWRDLLAAARGFCERMRAAGVIGERTYGRKINALTVAQWALQHREPIPRSAMVELLREDESHLDVHVELRFQEIIAK